MMFLLISLTIAFANEFISPTIFCGLAIYVLVLLIISIKKLKS
jgi:hypothetical protein